jgi:hypothetical protein
MDPSQFRIDWEVLCGFRPMPATDSGPCRSTVPVDAGPRFRSMPGQ